MRLNTLRIGEGRRGTVLLHGFLGSLKNLRTLALRWNERDPERSFLLMDLPGHGESPPLDDDTDLRAMAADVIETALAEGFRGFDLVGHSLGGRVALAADLVNPDPLGHIVLLDITPSPIDSRTSESGKVLELLVEAPDEANDRRELRHYLIERGLSTALTDWLMMNVVSKEGGGYTWRFDRKALQALHARVNQEDLWEAVSRLKKRLIVFRGARSKYVPGEDVARLEGRGARVYTLDAGHFIHVDAQEPLIEYLLKLSPS